MTDGCVIGIDGGGTGARLALLTGDGRRLEAACGPANVATDPDGALTRLDAAIRALAGEAGLRPGDLSDLAIHAGLAGAIDAQTAARAAARLPSRHASVSDDRAILLEGALDGGDGTVAAVGTGSFVGRRAGEAVRLIGGWGFRAGDQASGAWLGRGLCEAALLVADGLEAETPLAADLLARFGRDPAALCHLTLAADATTFAAEAPAVVAAARAGDPLGRRLMAAGADYLHRAVREAGWRPGERLCLSGGLGPAYADWLPRDLSRCLVPALGTGLDGALALARSVARRTEPALR